VNQPITWTRDPKSRRTPAGGERWSSAVGSVIYVPGRGWIPGIGDDALIKRGSCFAFDGGSLREAQIEMVRMHRECDAAPEVGSP
jgi:hypothetical protein